MKKLKFITFCLYIFISTIIISGSSYGIYFGIKFYRVKNSLDPKYLIKAIVQTGEQKEALKTLYLAELLQLSIDKPTNLYLLDEKIAENRLLTSPLIETAKVKKVFPHGIYIDYSIYQPVAKLADFENIGVDVQGHTFPLTPFYPPKNLPEVFLGFDIEDISYDKAIEDKRFDLVIELLKMLSSLPKEDRFSLVALDVSKAFSSRYAKSEIVLTIEDEILVKDRYFIKFPKILRFSLRNYQKQLGNFLKLRKTMLEDYKHQLSQISNLPENMVFQQKVIDLRHKDLAFIDQEL